MHFLFIYKQIDKNYLRASGRDSVYKKKKSVQLSMQKPQRNTPSNYSHTLPPTHTQNSRQHTDAYDEGKQHSYISSIPRYWIILWVRTLYRVFQFLFFRVYTRSSF